MADTINMTVITQPDVSVTVTPQPDVVQSITGFGIKGDPGTTSWAGITDKPNSFMPSVHTHTAANVTDFDTEVSNNTDVAANTTARHTHANSAVLDATTASFTTADETKLDGIATGAQVNTVTSVNTRTGAVTGLAEASDLTAHTGNTSNPHSVTKAQVGLGNVNDTSDLLKPISTATQTALDGKFTQRTITGTTNQVTVTNGDGVSGNPTLSLPQNIDTSATPTFSSLTAGTATDALGTALSVIRNNVEVGRIDNNASGLRVQARNGSLQLRGTGNTGIAIDASGNAVVAGTITGANLSGTNTGDQPLGSRTITGTTNQVTVTNGNGVSGNPTLSLPQDIHTGASPTFNTVTASLTGLASLNLPLTGGTTSGPVNYSAAATGTGFYGQGVDHPSTSKSVRVGVYHAGAYQISGLWGVSTPGNANYILGTTGSDTYFNTAAAGSNLVFQTGSGATKLAIVGSSGAVMPGGNLTQELGSSSFYWSNLYAQRHYFNSTAYIDGSTAGQANIVATNLAINGANGATGTFTSQDGKTVTVNKGIIVSIT